MCVICDYVLMFMFSGEVNTIVPRKGENLFDFTRKFNLKKKLIVIHNHFKNIHSDKNWR